MYTQFYGLREKPFSLSPDPRFLYLSDAHREALAHMLYGIEQGEGFIAISGEVGTGKTTLCRTLLQRLEPGTEVAFIFNPQLSGVELLEAINLELGLEIEGLSRRQLIEHLNRFLLAKKREDRRVLLIIDEAQTLEPDALEQVRLLSNLETDTEKLLQIILIGQPELDVMIDSPQFRQLRQRISVRWRLSPLGPNETREYVRHRLRIAAGAPRELFTELALREIHRRSGGIPRVVNLLCDRTLLAGYASDAPSIGLGLVTQTGQEVGSPRGRAAPRSGESRRAFRLPAVPWIPLAAGLVFLMLGALAWQFLRSPGLLGDRADATPTVLAEVVPAVPSPGRVPAARSLELAAEPEPAASDRGAAVAPEPAAADREIAAVPAVVAAAGRTPTAVSRERAGSAPSPAPVLSGQELGRVLAQTSPAATMASTLDATFRAWSRPELQAELLSFPQVLEALRDQGFRLLVLRGATLETLRSLDQPALLILSALDGAPRTALLRRLDADGEAELIGIGSESLHLPFDEVAQYWRGEAYVVWRDFEGLPSIMGPGSQGAPVAWLQHSLGRLGYYQGMPTGEFDVPTIVGVRSLQGEMALTVDGTVGPETKIHIYQAIDTYPVPRLGPLAPLAGAERGAS